MRLPPNVSEADFNAALAAWVQVVGQEWVLTSDEDVNTYRDYYSPYLNEPEERVASAAVCPTSTEEVQAVVRIANQYSIPVYAISTGKNLGYGGSAPAYSGSVVIDLKRMNKIIEVDEDRAFCLVEPGVSYFDMYRHLQETGSKLWVDTPDPGWGSLIGNSLERGSGYLPPMYRNHFDSHCGMEIVLANGDLVRTGMGALPNADSWQDYKSGFGPWLDGMFSQSNYGIVTKMGFWMMPEPDAYTKPEILLYNFDDLKLFVPILNFLENSKVFNGTCDWGSPLMANALIGEWIHQMEGAIPPPDQQHWELIQKSVGGYSDELAQYGRDHNIPYWKCALPMYGPAKALEAQWEYVKEKCAHIPGVKFNDNPIYKTPISPEVAATLHAPEIGIPSLKNFIFGARSALNPNPTHGHVWFAPIIPRTAQAIYDANKVFQEVAKRHNVPMMFPFGLPACYWERSFIMIFGFGISEDPAVNKQTRDCIEDLITESAKHGWSEYRCSPVFQDKVQSELSFNNHALLRLQETIKDAIDPKGILSPGRYGVWPKNLRRDR